MSKLVHNVRNLVKMSAPPSKNTPNVNKNTPNVNTKKDNEKKSVPVKTFTQDSDEEIDEAESRGFRATGGRI